MSGIAGFVAFLCVINFLVIFLIYPVIIKSKMEMNHKCILNVKIRISNYRYIFSCFHCGCMICLLLYEYYRSFRYSGGLDSNFFLVRLVWVIVIAVQIYRIILIYPRRYLLFQNNKMYYHNGFREICVENIRDIKPVIFGWKVKYWYLLLKTDANKRLLIDVLLFDKPEYIHTSIERMMES